VILQTPSRFLPEVDELANAATRRARALAEGHAFTLTSMFVLVAALFGVTGAFMTSSLLSSLLFGIQPGEPSVYFGTVAVLGRHRVALDRRSDAPGDAYRPGGDAAMAIVHCARERRY
jgi:hypothetical protein